MSEPGERRHRLPLLEPPALSRSSVDRTEPLRTDFARQQENWPNARVVLVEPESGRTPVRDGRLAMRPAAEVAPEPPADAVLLGEDDGVAYWAIEHEQSDVGDGVAWRDLRGCGAELSDTDAGLFTTAVAVLRWRAIAQYCARCGAATTHRNAGWVSECAGCGREEYPRTDPAVICLVSDPSDGHVLLARQVTWPEGRFSVLAGFVEAGESLEACVAREILEEVGLVVRDIRYLASQPWPFPRSLMLGFAAVGDMDAPLRPADGEIAQARWVSRAELADALERNTWSDRDGGARSAGELIIPPGVSIARRMLEAWAASRI